MMDVIFFEKPTDLNLLGEKEREEREKIIWPPNR